MSGSNAASTDPSKGGQLGIYGTLGVFAPGNVPGSRSNSASWVDKSGNLWLFGGYGFDSVQGGESLNDLWEFNPTTSEWAWISGSKNGNQPGVYGVMGTSAAANVPGARSGETSWTDSTGNFWLFGGAGAQPNTLLNDLWMFDPATAQWTWIEGSSSVGTSCNIVNLNQICGQPGVYGALDTPAAGNEPGSRIDAVSWSDPSGNFWMFGGYGFGTSSQSFGYLNDLWKFDPNANEWTWVSGTGTMTNCLQNSAGACFEYGQQGVYDTKGGPSAKNMPGGRIYTVGWTDKSGNLWLFGGTGVDETGGKFDLNDLWEFSASANEWAWMGGSSTGKQSATLGVLGVAASANVPGSRYGGNSWSDTSGNLWLFGGIRFCR